MESIFSTYLKLGFEHIADINAYDHILFLVALCAIYSWRDWKKVLILATAFTVGHSLTLALAAFEIISFPTDLIEFLIPVTVLLTCLHNLWQQRSENWNQKSSVNYSLALFFGLIHGMGFSNFLRATLMPGEESSLVTQLLAFNIGVELGQLVIVAIIMLITWMVLSLAGVRQRYWNIAVSVLAGIVALQLMAATYPF